MSLPPSFEPQKKDAPASEIAKKGTQIYPPTGAPEGTPNQPQGFAPNPEQPQIPRPAPSFQPAAVNRQSLWQQSATKPTAGPADSIPAVGAQSPARPTPPSFAAHHAPAGNAAGANTAVFPAGDPGLGSVNYGATTRQPKRRALRVGRALLVLTLVVLVAAGLWVGYLYHRVNSQLQRVDALSALPPTGGTTTLLAGSDERGDGVAQDGTQGRRSDSILLLHQAPNGQAALISLPRDSYVQIPGHDPNKLNAAYSLGGPALLVATVEQLLGIKIDHYMEVGMGGVEHLVDAVGGVQLCYDHAVNDRLSGMNWQPGCRHVGGVEALAFSRMRYSDPLGDIGRTQRQRQVISKTLHEVFTAPTFVSPSRQLALVDAGTGAVRVDQQTSTWDMLNIARALRKAGADHMEGTLPIVSYDYRPGRVGSTVKLDSEKLPGFVEKLQAGTLNAADLQVRP